MLEPGERRSKAHHFLLRPKPKIKAHSEKLRPVALVCFYMNVWLYHLTWSWAFLLSIFPITKSDICWCIIWKIKHFITKMCSELTSCVLKYNRKMPWNPGKTDSLHQNLRTTSCYFSFQNIKIMSKTTRKKTKKIRCRVCKEEMIFGSYKKHLNARHKQENSDNLQTWSEANVQVRL